MEDTPVVAGTVAAVVTQTLPIDKIKTSPFQARKDFDEKSIQALALSLKEEGLLNPITVRALADGTWELVAGERRLKAAKEANCPDKGACVRISHFPLINASPQHAERQYVKCEHWPFSWGSNSGGPICCSSRTIPRSLKSS
jgi:hypothetical protein